MTVTADPAAAMACDGLVVPGVGAFAACMAGVRAVDGVSLVRKRADAGLPVLGICVGMQVLFSAGLEHGVHSEGCGVWPGVVSRLETGGLPLPHMGWNTVAAPAGSMLFAGLPDGTRFYFVHSYGVRAAGLSGGAALPGLVTWASHGERFVAAVENGVVSATQFHPEKSGDAGHAVLSNWLESIR